MATKRRAVDPATLTEDDVAHMSPAECNTACDQLDQSLVGVLQEIDEHLNKANLILTMRILPAVQNYGEHSQRTWESVKFWKTFFEASANTKLNEPYVGDESIHSEEPLQGLEHVHEGQSLSFEQEPSVASGSGSEDGTPRALASKGKVTWAEGTPYDALQADLRQFESVPPPSNQSSSSFISQATRNLVDGRGAYAPPPESPELTVPDFQTETYDRLPTTKGKERAYNVPLQGSPMPRLKAGSDKLHPALLQRVLQKNFASPLPPNSSTPGKGLRTKVAFPPDLPSNWSGVPDLSQAPMSAFAFASPIPHRSSQSDDGDLSPPPSIAQLHYNQPSSPYSRTPAKEAARRVAKNLYDFSDSPEPQPPSAMKRIDERLQQSLVKASRPDDDRLAQHEEGGLLFREDFSRATSARPGEGGDADVFGMPHVRGALADFGGTTARIDDLLNDNSFAKVVDDQDGRAFQAYGDEEEEEEETEGEFPERSYALEEGNSETGPPGPEDTLFGMPQRKAAARHLDQERDSFEHNAIGAAGNGRGYRMMGMDQMDTLHGGQLLESEPFEPSPLSKRQR